MECVLCEALFPSKVKLVQHFRETHSVAKHRPRRSKVVEGIRQITLKEFDESEGEDSEPNPANRCQSFTCSDCGDQFATQVSFEDHVCENHDSVQPVKFAVSCIYCGQKCKNSRGATIHQVFCEQRINGFGFKRIHHDCPADDCGAIFKNQHQLVKHIKNHHAGESVKVISSPMLSRTTHDVEDKVPAVQLVQQQMTDSPMVTVTMKPHIGKTDGLQDLSLLITPTKGMDESTANGTSENTSSQFMNKELQESASITVEECWTMEGELRGEGETVLCVAEDGSVSHNPESNINDIIDQEKTFLLITDSSILNDKCMRSYECRFCCELFLEKGSLNEHMDKKHRSIRSTTNTFIKEEPEDDFEQCAKRKDEDHEWEFVSFQKNKDDMDVSICKGKFEYVCKLCNRGFLSELSYQGHIKNEECRTKKFKLPRMFSCHFKRCDSSFFKLTELQKHWQIAHKFTMASENHEFEDEKAFFNWVSCEEAKHKVRFTCDVRRRKPHRSERLMVCHRFHSLRTAAARKAAKREYSDKHNWVHKIQPCLCYARMKVYQDFNKDTCDYTGKIRVVYYYEHSHPESSVTEEEENILEHILQRNKRNRNGSFQELKGSEKVQHRQKLEKFARIAGREYRASVRNSKASVVRRSRKGAVNGGILNTSSVSGVHVNGNLLESDEFFDSPVEMVLDGQFDMSHEVLAGPAATNLDTLAIFDGSKVKQDCDETNESDVAVSQEDSEDLESEDSTIVLPASADDWGKLFHFARSRVEKEDDSALKAEASLVLPYEKVIGLISPSEQIPIFQQLWELAYPALNSEEVIQVVKINVVR